MAAVQYGSDDSVVTIKVFARYRMAVLDRPIPGSLTIDSSGDDGLTRDVDLFHRFGRPFDAPQGTLTVDVDLPGGLGGRMEGVAGSLAAPPGTSHQIYIAVVDPDGEVLAEPLVDMQAPTSGTAGLRGYGEDHDGAFTIEMLTDLSAGRIEITIAVGELTGRRPRQLVEGLRFLTEFAHPNSFRIRPAYGPAQSPLNPIPASASLPLGARPRRALVEGLATIQEFTTEQIVVPDLAALTVEQRMSIVDAARLLRGEIITATWSDIGPVHMHPGLDINPDERFAVRIYQAITVDFPDRVVVVQGYRQTDIPAARPNPDSREGHDDHVDVRLVPAGSDVAQFSFAPELPAT